MKCPHISAMLLTYWCCFCSWVAYLFLLAVLNFIALLLLTWSVCSSSSYLITVVYRRLLKIEGFREGVNMYIWIALSTTMLLIDHVSLLWPLKQFFFLVWSNSVSIFMKRCLCGNYLHHGANSFVIYYQLCTIFL